MLKIFDWLRRCGSGTELIAALEYYLTDPDLFPEEEKEVGPPFSALSRPCTLCRIYAPLACSGMKYCKTCLALTSRAGELGRISRNAVVIWGFVNHLPRGIRTNTGFYSDHGFGSYVHDDNHFLFVTDRKKIKVWIQELMIYHGSELKGLIQIFPTCGEGNRGSMGDVLSRAVHQDSRFPMDILRIRFYSSPYQLFMPHIREKKGILTFEVTEFLKWLEMTSIFRSLLRPEEQDMLFKLLDIKDKQEAQFYWGRFLGYISQEAKDMLSAWKIRQWSKNQIRLINELMDYVVYTT